ncbi:MAG TPA: S53 family peptidase [Gemmataceae bacterium]|nr:S53 family peptidase [Gemmataceae bacterium]
MLGRLTKSRRPNRRYSPIRLERLEDRATPAALSPTQVRQAYGFSQVAAVNGTSLTGAGETIAIVDAYNDPYIARDLATFDARYGLSAPPSFKVVNQNGSTTNLPQSDSGWAGEIALDVEWAHAIAPGANILLVEARSSSTNDLLQAIDYARSAPGVVAVSMSWGGSEFSSETSGSINSHFTTPAGHTGVAFVASAGDSGAGAIWPAVSTNVLGVGGTSLNLSGGGYGSESAWSGSGGGPSRYFSKPGYQTAYSGASRGAPDVSYDANPNTGFSVYNSYDGGWEQIGGTSAGAPQWAALVALADQGRALQGHGSLDSGTQLLPAIYSMPASNFHDVTSGSNGYSAKAGYDLSTGRGSPVAQSVISSLVSYGFASSTGPSETTSTGTSGSTTSTTTSGGTTGGTSGSGSSSGGWYWGWGWGWGWWSFGFFTQTASAPKASSGSQPNSAFTLDMSDATPAAVTSVSGAAKASVGEQVTATPVLKPAAELPWWLAQNDTGLAIGAVVEDDFAPISV